MPVVLLDRLPLPSLPAYTAVSVALLACSLYYAAQNAAISKYDQDEGLEGLKALCWAFGRRCTTVLTFMVHEPFCIWPLVNMAYCIVVLLGKCIQGAVFGELRVSESQAMKDTFWNFVFYKFIFVFGVLSVQRLEEVVLWCSWFTLLGFLHHLAQLARERAEYLSLSGSPARERWPHLRLLGLLAAILLASGAMMLVCAAVGLLVSLNTFAFMAAECVLLSLRTLQTMLRYSLHLYDVTSHATPTSPSHVSKVEPPQSARSHLNVSQSEEQSTLNYQAASSPRGWLRGGVASYYLELVFELGALLLDLLHHMHMLLWCNILLSMASLVICMQLRLLLHQLRARLARHRHRLTLQTYMRAHFPLASEEELRGIADDCAICWEKLDSARKLPCSHLFHTWCLQSWLEQDASCPTCRLPLAIGEPGVSGNHGNGAGGPGVVSLLGNALGGLVGRERDREDGETEAREQQPINNNSHVFHFDGSRYVSWLPSFSVEAAHSQLVPAGEIHASSQLHNMALQVQQMFPHYPLWLLVADLRVSHSAELTVENIVEGRLLPPAPMFNPDLVTVDQEASTPQQPASEWEASTDDTDGGATFSSVSSERQRTLARRREVLLSQARRRYLERSKESPPCDVGTSSSQ